MFKDRSFGFRFGLKGLLGLGVWEWDLNLAIGRAMVVCLVSSVMV